jgi:hypothetical protein
MNGSRMAAIAAMMTALCACGGGSPAANPPPSPPAPVPAPTAPLGTAGIFAVSYGQFTGVYTLLDNRQFSGVHFVTGAVLAGHPHGLLSATNTFSTPDPIAWANFIDDANQYGAQEPAGVFGRTFTSTALKLSITGSMGSFTAATTEQAGYGDGTGKTLYGDPIALSVAAGTYAGVMRSVGLGQPQQAVDGFTLDASGHWSATVASCTFAGTLVQHGTTGVYDAQAATSGSGCGFVPTLVGLVTPLAWHGGKPQWAVQLDSADNTQTAVFIVTKQ